MVRTLECPNCGGTVQLKYERTINAVCIQCLSILDATTPALQILQKFEGKQRYQPMIPLGTRGKLPSGQYEAIGFQIAVHLRGRGHVHVVRVSALQPLQGLSISDRVQRALERYSHSSRAAGALRKRTPSLRWSTRGKTYTHFQTADATDRLRDGRVPLAGSRRRDRPGEGLRRSAGRHLVRRIRTAKSSGRSAHIRAAPTSGRRSV